MTKYNPEQRKRRLRQLQDAYRSAKEQPLKQTDQKIQEAAESARKRYIKQGEYHEQEQG